MKGEDAQWESPGITIDIYGNHRFMFKEYFTSLFVLPVLRVIDGRYSIGLQQNGELLQGYYAAHGIRLPRYFKIFGIFLSHNRIG